MDKVAVYVRVSTEDQSLEHQEQEVVKYCHSRGWDPVVWKEHGSGSKDTRPELNEMLAALRSCEYKALVVWKLDRLGRSLPHLFNILGELQNLGVDLVCTTQGFDTTTPQGRFFFAVYGAFAELERAYAVERTKLRLDSMKKRGAMLGRPKGAKDKNPRRRSGYNLRWAGKKTSPHKSTQKVGV
jgi:putative DNA-invertase from lambdoid prophage Rac